MQPTTQREKEIWQKAFQLGQFKNEEALEVMREIHDALSDKRRKSMVETFWFEALDRLLIQEPNGNQLPSINLN